MVAPDGTVVARLLAVDEITVAFAPSKDTLLFAGVVLKFDPVMVTGVPTAPLPGLNPVRVGVGNTLKLRTLTRVIPLTVKEILPVEAPAGTVAVMLLVVADVTMAVTPLN